MTHEPGIYVEILICVGVDEIWRRTQVPDLHEQWDLRFTTIDYLPKHSEAEPQKFLYSTRIGFGLKINGEGESTGTREDGTGSGRRHCRSGLRTRNRLLKRVLDTGNTIQPRLEVDS